MKEYNKYITMAVDKLKDIPGACEILLFGSASNGETRRESDIDLAVILDDSIRGFCAGELSKFPNMIESTARQIKDELEKQGSPKLDILFFYKGDYDRGIELFGKRGSSILNEVGVSKYRFSILP